MKELLNIIDDHTRTVAYAAALRLALEGYEHQGGNPRDDTAVQMLAALIVDRLEAHTEALANLKVQLPETQ